MKNRRNAVTRVAMYSILVVLFGGICSAQDFGNLPENKHTVRLECLSTEVQAFCGMFAKELKKDFKLKDAIVHGTYTLLIGGHEVTDANHPDPVYVVYGVLTRTVLYRNHEEDDPEIANHFRRIHTIGSFHSDFKTTAKRLADIFVREIQKDIAKIQR
jgi:hypothetical protein